MTTDVQAKLVELSEDRLEEIVTAALSGERGRRIHLDGTINLGHMLSMGVLLVSLVGGGFTMYSTFDKRLMLLETQMTRQTEVLDRSIRADEKLTAIRERLDRLERAR